MHLVERERLSVRGMVGLQRNPAPAFRAMSSGTEDGEGLVCCRKVISPRANFNVKEITAQIIPLATSRALPTPLCIG